MRKLLAVIASALALLGLTACTGVSASSPTTAVGDSYELRLAWGNSLERGQLVKQIDTASMKIRSAAYYASDSYNDSPDPDKTDTKTGETFKCKTRFWHPTSKWTYIVTMCYDKDGEFDLYQSTKDSSGVHVIGGKDDTSVAVYDYYTYSDVRYSYVSVDENRVCYQQDCTDGRGQLTTVKDMATLERQAAKYLAQSVKALPLG